MKKIALVLIVLLTLTGAAFAEVDLSGEFAFGAVDLGTDVSSAAITAEVNLKATVDDYTTVAVELDAEGADWTGRNIGLDDFRVTSDITGVLGVDAFSLSITAGLFDTYFNNWNYVSRSGEEYKTGLAGGYLWTEQPTTDFAAAMTVGVAGYSLKYWQDFAGKAMTVAVSGAPVEGLNFLLGYHAAFAAVADGSLWVEGGYSFAAGPATLTIPASFVVNLGAASDNLGWSSGVAADVDAYHFAVGVGGAEANMFKDVNVEVSTSVVENADIYVIADLDASTNDIFQSVDLGGKYMFGAFGVGAGYVVSMDEANSTSIWSDNTSITGSGAYIYFDLDY